MNGDALDALFDEHGLLAGVVGEQVWPQLCLSIEGEQEEAGWDKPARVLAIANPVNTEAAAGAEAVDRARDTMTRQAGRAGAPGAEAPDEAHLVLDGIPFAVSELGEVNGHPVTELWGFTAPPWAAALVIIFEGWTVHPVRDEDGQVVPDPLKHLAYSQHPRRVEIRQVMMFTRGGAQYAVSRERGQAAEVAPAETGGFLVEILRRSLGLPTDPAPTTTADWLGRLALESALRVVSDLTSAGDGEGNSEGKGAAGVSGPSAMPSEVAAGASELREALASLGADERVEMLESLFVRGLTAAVAHVAWKATGHGEVGVPKPLRRKLRDVAYRGVSDEEHLWALRVATEVAARLSFTDLVASKQMAAQLPPEVAKAPAGWADEGLLARRLCWREWSSQPRLWEHVAQVVGRVPEVAVELLRAAGWASDAPAGPQEPDAS